MHLFATAFIVLGGSIVQATNGNTLRGGRSQLEKDQGLTQSDGPNLHNELSRRLFYGAGRVNPYSFYNPGYYNPIDLELEQGLINRDREGIHDVDNLENAVTSGLTQATDTDSTQATLNMVKNQLDATLVRHSTAAHSDEAVASDSAAPARVTPQPAALAGVPRTDEVKDTTAAAAPVDQQEYDALQEQLAEMKLKVQQLEKDKASAAQAKTGPPAGTNSDDKSPTEAAGASTGANTHESGKSDALASLPLSWVFAPV